MTMLWYKLQGFMYLIFDKKTISLALSITPRSINRKIEKQINSILFPNKTHSSANCLHHTIPANAPTLLYSSLTQ